MADWCNLSEDARLVWGKTNRDRGLVWLPLFRHLADSADVAGLLWDVWLPVTVRQRIAGSFPGGFDDGRVLVRWLAGVHDIGKATPAFTWQVGPLREAMREHGFTFDRQVEADRGRAPHGTAGQIVLTDWLTGRHGWDRASAGGYAVVVGGHHGVPPTVADLTEIRARPYLLGAGGIWPAVQDELLGWLTRRVAATDRLAVWRGVILPQPVQVLLTAIVIVADWIASNEQFFPYGFRQEDASDRLQQAWEELDLPTPWRAVDTTGVDAARFLAQRFKMPPGAQPYPVQAAVLEQARAMPLPGLLIVEAPMGEGKTEAALAAVEVLAGRSGAGGCFVALPTRATSDAMFSRVLGWLSRLRTPTSVGVPERRHWPTARRSSTTSIPASIAGCCPARSGWTRVARLSPRTAGWLGGSERCCPVSWSAPSTSCSLPRCRLVMWHCGTSDWPGRWSSSTRPTPTTST